jgi:hypothetical protein
MILAAGPRRSGTSADPERITKNVPRRSPVAPRGW